MPANQFWVPVLTSFTSFVRLPAKSSLQLPILHTCQRNRASSSGTQFHTHASEFELPVFQVSHACQRNRRSSSGNQFNQFYTPASGIEPPALVTTFTSFTRLPMKIEPGGLSSKPPYPAAPPHQELQHKASHGRRRKATAHGSTVLLCLLRRQLLIGMTKLRQFSRA